MKAPPPCSSPVCRWNIGPYTTASRSDARAAQPVIRRMACILLNLLRVRQHRLNLRQRDAERTAVAVPGFQREVTAIDFNSPFRDGKAEARPTMVARSRLIDAVKTVKNARLKLFWN